MAGESAFAAAPWPFRAPVPTGAAANPGTTACASVRSSPRNAIAHLCGVKLLAELRQRQQTPARRAELRERVKVEHALP
jgi:hypothetical protein